MGLPVTHSGQAVWYIAVIDLNSHGSNTVKHIAPTSPGVGSGFGPPLDRTEGDALWGWAPTSLPADRGGPSVTSLSPRDGMGGVGGGRRGGGGRGGGGELGGTVGGGGGGGCGEGKGSGGGRGGLRGQERGEGRGHGGSSS